MADIVKIPLCSVDIGEDKALSTMDEVNLSQMTQHPGWLVLLRMFNSACRTATRDVITLDPEEKGYQQALIARQTRARNVSDFSDLVIKSVQWHIAKAGTTVEAEEIKPEEPLSPNQGRFIGPSKRNN